MNESPMREPLTPEYLNAYVDGELAADERARVMALLESDPEFKARVCELRALKERVKGAYAETPARPAVQHAGGGFQPIFKQMLAAGLLLALGLGGGWLARDRMERATGYDRLAGLPAGYQAITLKRQVDANKVILHLDSRAPERLAAALNLAEKLLAERGADGRVEVVVNNYGIDLLRADISPLAGRVENMARQHANLSFVACDQTVARLQREGVKVTLLPAAQSAGSAINAIMTRMGQGWVYVKV